MRSKYQIFLISLILVVFAISIMAYKVNVLGFPLFEGENRTAYSIEAKIDFKGTGDSAFISLALPAPQKYIFIKNEVASSEDFGFVKSNEGGFLRGEWSKRKVKGKHTIYYSVDVILDEKYKPKDQPAPVFNNELFKNLEIATNDAQAVKSILSDAIQHSNDDISLTAYLIAEFNREQPKQTIQLIKQKYIKSKRDLQNVLAYFLAHEDVKFHKISGIYLNENKKNSGLEYMIEVYQGDKYQLFDINKGKITKAKNLFFWQRGQDSLIETEGVENTKVSFSISKSIIPARNAAVTMNKEQSSFIDFSLYALPVESQNAFKRLLLVPIGALVVVFLRVFIGLKTSGTFMSVLIAMAFVQTGLISGIAMFLFVVASGLLVRQYLSSLNLLLVTRISAVLIIVVAIMVFFAIFTYKLGIQDSVTITFFPMIILAWTIERMSILWEEDGPREVFIQGGGSLLVAVLAYFAMVNKTIAYMTFNFPESLLIILALIILIGRYSGYRLSELYRFASMADKK
jgi:hypothetical protein